MRAILGLFIMAAVMLASPFDRSGDDENAERAKFSGEWRQLNERCIPPPKSKFYSYKMRVEASDNGLHIQAEQNSARGEKKLDLSYEIGGKELVYTGMDGDEFHSKVRWEGNSLVFTVVEHERGQTITSTETWTMMDAGKSLQRVKVAGDPDEAKKAVYVLERVGR